MSHNQSRAERSETTQYRKTGRSGGSNQQRHFSGGVSAKGGGGGSAPSNPAGRGYKKYNNNAQIGQQRARGPNVDSDNGAHAVQNGPHQHPPGHITNISSNVKPTDAPKNIRAVPRAPTSNVSAAAPTSNVPPANSESAAPTTPAKGDPSKSFPLQFGSISPGLVNGVQIPARTSSAPPNLDEQKKAQARQGSLRGPPAMPVPVPKQHLPKKDNLDQKSAGEAQTMSKSKRDTQISPSPPQTQKPGLHPIPGVPMPMPPFHQPQVPVQFGGPNPQIQSQPMPGASMPLSMQMPLPMGNPPMQQPMFITGLQPHPMQSQGMMHQGQNFNFSPPMSHQIPTPLGNMGINMPPPFQQQQAGKFSASRKTVKITHPETHEELKLDGSPAPRAHSNVPASQSQPIPSFPPNHPMNFYPNSYNAPSMFFPPGSSVPMNSSQVPPGSHPPRLPNQVTIKQPTSSHEEKEPLPVTSSTSVGKLESLETLKLQREDSNQPQKEVEPPYLSSLTQLKPSPAAATSTSAPSSGSINVENDVPNTSVPMDEARNGVVVPDSIEDKPNKPSSIDQQDQDGSLSTSLSSLPSQTSEAESVKTKSTASGAILVPEAAKELSTNLDTSSEASSLIREGGTTEVKAGPTSRSAGTNGVNSRLSETEITGNNEKDEVETSLKSLSLESPEITGKVQESSDYEATLGGLSGNTVEKPEEFGDGEISDNIISSAQLESGENADSSVSVNGLSAKDDKISGTHTSLSVGESNDTKETGVSKSTVVDKESAPVLVLSPPETGSNPENKDVENSSGGFVSNSSSSLKDKVSSDANVAKNTAPRGKKKMKELYRKAEAAGTSSDLYNAYKGPEEKKETVTSTETMQNNSSVTSAEVSQDNDMPTDKKTAASKAEPDDWEDAAEMSPDLDAAKNENQGNNGLTTKKYSRDFLLKFVEQCPDLPEGFEITSDIADVLMVNINMRDSYPSPGRNMDRGSRPARGASGFGDEDKWTKFPGNVMHGRGDMRAEVGYGGNLVGLRPVQGGNYGVLRNPRAQTPVQYAGGILSGPMQSFGPHGGPQRNNFDSDTWQRGKGLMPYPHTPMPVMHRAEKKYEVGKVTDEEEAKQRQLKGILNKLTPQNFDKLFRQVKEVNIDNVVTLNGVISQIFDKALMEPTFCEMYADFCFHLAADLPDLNVDNEKITFKRLLLNKCQEEFERGEREEEEANKAEEEGENKKTPEEREENRLRVRRRMLGNIRLIGELYKKRMLTERIMHECINKLLGNYQNPDEENIEALCKLMSTIGEMIDHPKAKDHMDAYFEIMAQLSNNMKISSRVRFMLKDSIDLRKNKWQQRRKVEGPKKIEEVHRDAAQERQAQSSRLGRAPSMGGSIRRGPPPMEYSPRTPNMLSSPSPQMGGYRPVSPQVRGGYGSSQDVRVDERHSYENRTVPTPLPQRPLGDDSITLGPQGGLVRGMGSRVGPGLNGFSYGQREDLMPRYGAERFDAPSTHDQSHTQERNAAFGGYREVRNTDRGFASPPSSRGGPPASGNSVVSSEKVLTEDQLRDKSLSAIKEYYSARDEKEVALCIKDLNSPGYHPSMISLWITDSFERKDTERDLLTKLIINLTKKRDGTISEDQLVKGFESALAVLEDAVNDAPKAAEFLGRTFARVIIENVVPLSEIGRLVYEGGEEKGSLVEVGLAAEVMGTILEIIKSEKGDSVLKEIRLSSNIKLENFRPPRSNKTLRIDKFM